MLFFMFFFYAVIFLFYLATMFDTNEKNAAMFLFLFTNNVLTFTLTFSMLQASSSHQHKNTNWIQKTKMRTKKKCVWLEKQIAELCVIAQILDSAFGFLWRFPNLNLNLSVWKSWRLVLKQMLRLIFLIIEKNWQFLKIWFVKSIYACLHTYNENLELLAELHISALT